jgi:dienelactone hydrolase
MATAVDTTVVPGPLTVTCSTVSLAAGDVALPAERCAPAEAEGPLPAVLVLNGCGGYEADAGITTAITRRLAEVGLIALRLDYLAAKPAPPFTYCTPAAVVVAGHELLRALVAAVATLRADPSVDPARVGAVGYSLGGLAVGLAQIGGGPFGPLESAGFGAIGLLSAVIPSQVADEARNGKLPPLMIVHGADDAVVAPTGAEALADAAATGDVPHEIQVLPAQGHEWTGQRAALAADSFATFLSRILPNLPTGQRD